MHVKFPSQRIHKFVGYKIVMFIPTLLDTQNKCDRTALIGIHCIIIIM